MKKRTFFRIAVLVVILAGSFILLRSSGKPQPSGCKESMETCCKKRSKPSPGSMIWETLSGQFFSFAGSTN
jgi:hypothetical protein